MARVPLSPRPSGLEQDTDKVEPFTRPAQSGSSCQIDDQSQDESTGDNAVAGQQLSGRHSLSSQPQLDAAPIANTDSLYMDELINMYYDTSFDAVHFDVMGLALSPLATGQTLPQIEVEDQNDHQEVQNLHPTPDRPISRECTEIQSSGPETAIPRHDSRSACIVQNTTNITPLRHDSMVRIYLRLESIFFRRPRLTIMMMWA